jgi:hypothetical protein
LDLRKLRGLGQPKDWSKKLRKSSCTIIFSLYYSFSMSIPKQARGIIETAEKALAGLASDAARERQYEAAATLISVAQAINELPKRFARVFGETTVGPEGSVPPAVVASASSGAGPVVMRFAKPERAKGNEYPKFARDGDNLVKIAWSKAEKSEYEHKSPKSVMSVLVGALGKVGAGGKRFAMDAVIPLAAGEDGAEVPPYQVYLCVAWLRQIGAVVQHGRQGYSLRGGDLAAAVEKGWGELASR